MAHRILAMILGCSMVLGCTTKLTVTQLDPKNVIGSPLKGVIYKLPRAYFTISITRQLVDCPLIKASGWDPTFSLQATIKPNLVADQGQIYLLNYEKLSAATKVTDFTIKLYNNGTLQGINLAQTDKTGEIISSIVTGAVALAPLAVGMPPISPEKAAIKMDKSLRAPQIEPEPVDPLKIKVRKALEEVKKYKEELATTEKAIVQALARRDPLQKKEKYGIKEIEDNEQELSTLYKKQQTLQDRINKANNDLTHVETVLFNPEPNYSSLELKGEEALDQWFDKNKLQSARASFGIKDDLKKSIMTTLLAVCQAQITPSPLKLGATQSVAGLVYRQPSFGEVMVCQSKSCLSNGEITVPPADRLATLPATFPQMGVLGFLPLTNHPFDDNTLVASFAEDGTLTTLTFNSKSSAEKMANTFKESATQAGKLPDAIQSATQKSMDAETARINAEKAKLDATLAKEKAQKDLDTFRSTK